MKKKNFLFRLGILVLVFSLFLTSCEKDDDLPKKDTWETLTTLDGLAHNTVYDVIEDDELNIWIGTQEGLSKYSDGEILSYNKTNGFYNLGISSIAKDANGTIWFGASQFFWKYNGNEFENYFLYFQEDTSTLYMSTFVDEDGYIWEGTDIGIFQLSNDLSSAFFYNPDTSKNNYYTCILEDSENNIWVASTNGGVYKYDGTSWYNFDISDGMPSNNVRTLFEDQGHNMWFGFNTAESALVKFTGNELLKFDVAYARAIGQDSKGNLWVATQTDGLYKFNKDMEQTHYTTVDGIASETIYSLLVDSKDRVWIGTDNGLTLFTPVL